MALHLQSRRRQLSPPQHLLRRLPPSALKRFPGYQPKHFLHAICRPSTPQIRKRNLPLRPILHTYLRPRRSDDSAVRQNALH